MTAIGLCVAVPAVLGYNWLLRRKKVIQDDIGISPAICTPIWSAAPAWAARPATWRRQLPARSEQGPIEGICTGPA